jgi:HlyD family secretion protein
MNSYKPFPSTESRSKEVQDIISRTPGGLLQWGTFAILFVFLIFFTSAWFIRYPDIITADVTITTVPSPVILVSRSPGKLHLIKRENDAIKVGELIAFVQSGAAVSDVLALENTLYRQRSPPTPNPVAAPTR